MDGLFDFLHDLLPSSWFDDAQQHFGTELTDEMIVLSVQEASEFFNMNAPMSIHEDWTTGVMTGMTFTDADDILVFNRQQLLDMGITDKEGFDLVMTHEGAHRALQGLDTGFSAHQEELCCDYMAGVRAGLNGLDEGKMATALAETMGCATHPDGAIRVGAIEAGVAFAHDYMEAHNGVPPTFSDCLEHFEKTEVYAAAQTPGHINLRPELALTGPEGDHGTEDAEYHQFHHGRFGNATGDYIDDSNPADRDHIKGLFVDNRSYHLHEAQVAKENAEWHLKRAKDAIARGDLAAARDHEYRASGYERAQRDHLATAKKCTK